MSDVYERACIFYKLRGIINLRRIANINQRVWISLQSVSIKLSRSNVHASIYLSGIHIYQADVFIFRQLDGQICFS